MVPHVSVLRENYQRIDELYNQARYYHNWYLKTRDWERGR